MHDEFTFDSVRSVEFCVSVKQGSEHENFLVPSDRSVQDELHEMLRNTVAQFGGDRGEIASYPPWQQFELSEKYASKETLIANLASDEMVTISDLYNEEGWPSNARALRNAEDIMYYFGVFRDHSRRKLIGVRRAAQFKSVVKSRLIRLADDSLTMVNDHLFRLDNEFDFLITRNHVYILHPAGLERIAQVEQLVSAKAREKALALGRQITFVDFASIAEFVAHHKRAARAVVALVSREGLNNISRSKLAVAARETDVVLVNIGRKISPATGSEMAFLELLDDRRYATAIKTGPKEAYVANSRKPVRSTSPTAD
jgi:hypothetical protein